MMDILGDYWENVALRKTVTLAENKVLIDYLETEVERLLDHLENIASPEEWEYVINGKPYCFPGDEE